MAFDLKAVELTKGFVRRRARKRNRRLAISIAASRWVPATSPLPLQAAVAGFGAGSRSLGRSCASATA